MIYLYIPVLYIKLIFGINFFELFNLFLLLVYNGYTYAYYVLWRKENV